VTNSGPTAGKAEPDEQDSSSWTQVGAGAGDRIYSGATTASALVVPLMLATIFIAVFIGGWPALK